MHHAPCIISTQYSVLLYLVEADAATVEVERVCCGETDEMRNTNGAVRWKVCMPCARLGQVGGESIIRDAVCS